MAEVAYNPMVAAEACTPTAVVAGAEKGLSVDPIAPGETSREYC